MGGVERAGDLGDDPHRARRLERRQRLREQLVEVDPVHEAHRDEQQAVVLAGLVHGDDVGVLDRRGDPRLGLEALAEHRVVGSARRRSA